MRGVRLMLISTALTCAIIGNTYYERKQFYPTIVHITKSNPTMTVIYTQSLIFVFMINAFLWRIFFGTVHANELEHLVEKVWYAVTETCLAFTVFRDDFSPKFIALFILLLFVKSFHWLAEDRVDYMERSPVITWLFQIRIVTLLGLLFATNITMIHYACYTIAMKGPSVQLVFGFEYSILLTVVVNIVVKYILHTIYLQSENPWDNKPIVLLYTELIIGLFRVILYMCFVILMIKLFTLPLFTLRPMYYTIRDFKKAFHDIVMFRRAIKNMNTLYPDATAEELAAADNVCIICREEMVAASKKLPCNHIFHTACLRLWFQRQQTCPTCRLNILRPTANNTGARQQNQQQGGQQLGHQAPQEEPINPIGHVFQLPAFWAEQQAAGAAPQQQQQTPNNSGSTPTTAAQNTNTANAPVFVPPFPAVVPLPPIPTPPPNLTELSEEELRAMEGNLRQAVEARIQTLQKVQLLLDVIKTMMSQYETAAATANIPIPTPTSNVNVTPEAPSTAKTGTSSGKEGSSTSKNEQPEVKVEANVPTASTSNESTSVLTPNLTVRTEADPSNEQEMLRRRRLQKFSSQFTAE